MPRNKRKPRIPINERIKKIKNPKILDLFNEMQSSIHEREKRLNMCPGEQETMAKLQCYWVEVKKCVNYQSSPYTFPQYTVARIPCFTASSPQTCAVIYRDAVILETPIGGSSITEFSFVMPGDYVVRIGKVVSVIEVLSERKLSMISPSLASELEASANLHLGDIHLEGNLPLVTVERLRRQSIPEAGYVFDAIVTSRCVFSLGNTAFFYPFYAKIIVGGFVAFKCVKGYNCYDEAFTLDMTVQKKNSKGHTVSFCYNEFPIFTFTEPGLYIISFDHLISPILLDVQYLDLKEEAADVDEGIELLQKDRGQCLPYEADETGVMTPRWNNVTPAASCEP